MAFDPKIAVGDAQANEYFARRCRRWNCAVTGCFIFVIVATATFNYFMDIYGLFGNIRGKKIIGYDNERTAKFLLSYKYIPANFDGLLVGTSISDNWDTSRITGFRAYNASIAGGNITEEKLIADNVLARGHIKLAMFVIHPYLTETVGRKSGYMNPQEYWGALGSIQLFRAYYSRWLINKGSRKPEFSGYGQNDFAVAERPVAGPISNNGSELAMNSDAVSEYKELLVRARASGAKIVGIIPPVATPIWQARCRSYQDYYRKIEKFFAPDERIIDFNTDEFNRLRNQSTNFPDGVHLSPEGAAQVMSVINERLEYSRRSYAEPPEKPDRHSDRASH